MGGSRARQVVNVHLVLVLVESRKVLIIRWVVGSARGVTSKRECIPLLIGGAFTLLRAGDK